MDEDGNVELPLTLGRALNRVCVFQIGKITLNPSFKSGNYIYPVGFECKRKYNAVGEGNNNKVQYTCNITEQDDLPLVFPRFYFI